MAKSGLAFPVTHDGAGRFSIVSGDEQLAKIIALNLMYLESSNPFQQDLGLTGELVFSNNDEQLLAELRRRVAQLFRRLQLQNRARLAEAASVSMDSATQELTVSITYINLEENKPASVTLRFPASLSGGTSMSATFMAG